MNILTLIGTAWGSKKGGINAFNTQLSLALARTIQEHTVVCVVLSATQRDIEEAAAGNVQLVSLDRPQLDKYDVMFSENIYSRIKEKFTPSNIIWVGHDIVTGPIARSLAEIKGDLLAAFMHMSYSDYYLTKTEDVQLSRRKIQEQKDFFAGIEIAIAVGPLLRDRLKNLTKNDPLTIIPGLPEIEPRENSFPVSAISFGRLDLANDRVKQGRLSVSAFAKAYAQGLENSGIPDRIWNSAKITTVGTTEKEAHEIRRLAEKKAGRIVNVDPYPFIEDVNRLHEIVAGSSVALVLSWHDGFALTGWEAIAAGVPLILSKSTGLYQHLSSLGGSALGCITPVQICGQSSGQGENSFTDEDERVVAKAILECGANLEEKKSNALNLRKMLIDSGCNWDAAARLVAARLEIPTTLEGQHNNLKTTVDLHVEEVPEKKGRRHSFKTYNSDLPPVVDQEVGRSDQLEGLERALSDALSAYKGQPEVFIEPTVTKDRDSIDSDNLLPELVNKPHSALILAQPQFGQTCLSFYMRLEAYKQGAVWVYIDAKYTKTRKVKKAIKEQLERTGVTTSCPDCIIIDSWDSNIVDHANMLKCLDTEYPKTPILVMINYTESNYDEGFAFSKLRHSFEILHLLPLRRKRVRELVTRYGEAKNWPPDDGMVVKVVKDLAALNVHRTPLNCLTLLRVFEKERNKDIVNRTKLIKSLLFILFTDSESFTYAGSKPDVEDCEYILGRFCKTLIDRATRSFTRGELLKALREYCQEKLITVDVDVVIDILESNNILLSYRDALEFKHSHWIFYFAATYMLHDTEFAKQILSDRRYVNFPEIIEFYTGCDGRRVDAVTALLSDVNALVKSVDGKIGIPEDFNPYNAIVWNPSDDAVQKMREEVSEKVEASKVPTAIKDQHADQNDNVVAPYDQSIQNFLHNYSVLSLMQAIKAASRALRNSKYVDSELKTNMLHSIARGWSSIARVVFILAPTLAQSGRAAYDGFGLILGEGFEGPFEKKVKDIFLAGPLNVVRYLKDELSSGKIAPLVGAVIKGKSSDIQKHFLAHFLVRERPEGWYRIVADYMNCLHRNSFYLWDLSSALNSEITIGFTTPEQDNQLKMLKEVVVAKHVEGPRKTLDRLQPGEAISAANKLPIDKIRAAGRKRPPLTPKKKSATSDTLGDQQSLRGDSQKTELQE